MSAFEEILENQAINAWTRHFVRSPRQYNKPHESDAEIIEMEGGSDLLAVTVDTVAEEIAQGLYRDPFTMGWVTVMSNFSDLAAVGARPLGIVISVSLPPEGESFVRDGIAQGMAAACRALGVFILGGDTNTAREVSLTGSAFGLLSSGKQTTRAGCRPGDVLFLSGGAGRGNALGLRVLARMPEEYFPESSYRPVARLREGGLIRRFATGCMDTSDGLFITLDQLTRLNGLGFRVEAGWDQILAPDVLQFCGRTGIPPWFMAAGIHGEFELVFTVPENVAGAFLEESAEMGFHPIRLGVVQDKPCLELALPSGEMTEIDMAPLRNLWAAGASALPKLLEEHHAWGKKWRLEP